VDERRLLRFREFVLEEGELWDAMRVGVDTGVKAFKHKRKDQSKQSEVKKLSQQIFSAEGADLRLLVKKIVDNGYSIKNGEVVAPSREKLISKEVLECTRTKTT